MNELTLEFNFSEFTVRDALLVEIVSSKKGDPKDLLEFWETVNKCTNVDVQSLPYSSEVIKSVSQQFFDALNDHYGELGVVS